MLFEQLDIVEPIPAALREKGYLFLPTYSTTSYPCYNFRPRRCCVCSNRNRKRPRRSPFLCYKNYLPGNKETPSAPWYSCPTRELAMQVSENIDKYGTRLSVRSVLLYGGVPQTKQSSGDQTRLRFSYRYSRTPYGPHTTACTRPFRSRDACYG